MIFAKFKHSGLCRDVDLHVAGPGQYPIKDVLPAVDHPAFTPLSLRTEQGLVFLGDAAKAEGDVKPDGIAMTLPDNFSEMFSTDVQLTSAVRGILDSVDTFLADRSAEATSICRIIVVVPNLRVHDAFFEALQKIGATPLNTGTN
jgi:hypothetical protein